MKLKRFSLAQLLVVLTGVSLGFAFAPLFESRVIEPIKAQFFEDPFQDMTN